MRQKSTGRKRGLAVDVLGLVIAVVVVAASAHENAVGITLLDKVAADTVEKALVDQGFKNAVVAHGEKVGIEVEVVERNPAQTGFVPQAKRWVVERAYGILMLHRRLVRDYEHLPRSSESRVYWAMTAVILRRLTGATAAAWHTA
jgi:transposase